MRVGRASDLEWRTGFGWGPVLALVGGAMAAAVSAGAARWAATAVAVAAGAYAAYQYRRWNSRAWRRVHFRAMFAYADIAERERAGARRDGREFDARRACAELGLLLCGDDKPAVVDAMLAELGRYEGAFLAGLVERHAGEALQGAPFELRRDVLARLRSMRFGPELVIAFVIENVYGGAEAARYAVALATGSAT